MNSNKLGAVEMTLQVKGLPVSSDNFSSMSGSNRGRRELIPTRWEDRPMTWGCVREGRRLPVGERTGLDWLLSLVGHACCH